MKNYNTKIRLFSTLVLSYISILGFSQTSTDTPFHDTKGNIEVTKAGQLQYTLAVDVPPGIKDMNPNISLAYVSGAGNGLAGYNWNITGIPAISRVGKNLEKDGATRGVQLDYTDYYSFGGQRLILKSGEYGKDGAEYVTEKYSNIRIKSVGAVTGQAWQGPEYWEVTLDDGSQAWYGATSSGDSPARTPIDYNIVKSRDVNGNYITYNYILNGNVSVISSIQWGGNEIKNTPHINKIEFIFGIRPRSETAYIKGVGFSQSRLLDSIVVSTNGKPYKKYRISYREDLQGTTYRYLDKITILNSQNEESTPVVFKYEQSGTSNAIPSNISTSLKYNKDNDVIGDFDGDGNLDLLRYHSSVSSKIPQAGLYLYKDFYSITYSTESPVLINSSLQGLKDAIAVNLKKNNIIGNRQGFVTYKKVTNPATSKSDLELSFYSITENSQLNLDYQKVIPNANYDRTHAGPQITTKTTIIGIKNVDLNGDGLSEVILQLNDRGCWPVTPGNSGSPQQNECDDFKRYYVIDPDESIQGDQWYYPLELYSDAGEGDVFTNCRAGDFNGDGILDFLKLGSDKKPFLITFNKNSGGKYESNISLFNPTNDQTIDGYWESSIVGDYNGDGLSDIMIPETSTSKFWNKYISKGNGFTNERVEFKEPTERVIYQNGANISIYNPQSFVAYDINNDGKTELLALKSIRSYYLSNIQDNNHSPRYETSTEVHTAVYSATGGYGTTESPYSHGVYLYNVDAYSLYLNDANVSAELAVNARDLMGISVDQWTGAMLRKAAMGSAIGWGTDVGDIQRLVSHQYYDIAMEGRIKSISQGGITTDIAYKQLDKGKNPGLYEGTKTEAYPYVEINQSTGMYVVAELTQSTTSDKKLKQDFRYRGLTSNILGRGMIGFRKTARSSWYADGFENTKVWSGVEIDPTNDGVPVKEWSIRSNDDTKIFPVDVSENNTQLLSFKSSTYQIDRLLNGQIVATVSDADKARVVTAIVPKTSKGKDFLTGATAESTVTYGEYYLPTQSISSINAGYAVTTTTYEYNSNPTGTGANYYIGRPTSKSEVVQAYSDTQSGKDEFTYENNRLKTIKKWNGNNTGYILDTYDYDGFGNVIQKVVGNSMDSRIQTSKSEYDATGRFVVKQTDNLGLETFITYNDWGQILTQTDPLGNTLNNFYDNWGKLGITTTNFRGLTSYTYEKDNNFNTVLTKIDSDDNITKTYTNKLGQVYKVSTKALGQGQYISKETQYDVLGRKTRESEPYFEGQSVSQWNTIAYDDSLFPARITATAFNGKQTETSVSGLTTSVKELNGYGRTTSRTTDALGNVISSTDPGGTIQFSYNAAGKQIQAKYAENIVTTKYDPWGRKSEFNDPSNGIYKYEYNGLGQAKRTISPKGTKEYTYNALGQLITQKEFSTIDNGYATNKTISFTYNDKGLLTKKSGTVAGQALSTVFTYDPKGRMISSSESSNGKTYTEKGIIFDNMGRITSYDKELKSPGGLTKVSIENIYNTWNGELYQIKDKNSGRVLWQIKETNSRGQVVRAGLGSADILNTYDANGFLTGINHSSQVKPGILQVSYSFDAIRNELKTRTTGGDLNITESFDYDNNNRLINWTNPITGVKPTVNRNVYDVKGRVTENDQVGTIKFQNTNKIYQPSGMSLNANGVENYKNDLIQSVIYNENNDPVHIDGEKGRVSFGYGLGSMRQRVDIARLSGEPSDIGQPLWQNVVSKLYSEDGSFEVVVNPITGQEKHILYIEGGPYDSNIIYLKNFGEKAGSYKFLHKDYLGSILAISDEAGNKVEQRHYDAWGNFTHLKIGNASTTIDQSVIKGTLLLIDRGYTGHEHFMDVGIIHMNGRLYDPLLRRFLNADENIQDPTNTQNYNKYGYVMNNPMMYNDPNGEFWWWLAGALVGGYFNGVQANGGQWNPVKWDWQKSWSAVVGGAIGGAAISGALGNISSNAGAIKSFLPGIVSGGLNSAFSGGNFLGGAIGGISYTGNLFDNKVTSTNGISAGYRYINSPTDDYSGGGWDDLTKSILLNYVRTNFCEACSTGALQQKAGTMFENAFHSIMGTDYSSLNYESNVKKFPGFYKGKPRNTVPDGIYDLIRDNYYTWEIGNLIIPTPIRKSSITFTGVQFAEVKAMDGTLYNSSNQGQLSSMLYSMSKNKGVSKYGGQFIIGTTSDTVISPALVTQGLLYKIQIIQMTAQYRMINSFMQMRLYNGGASPSTAFIK